VITTEPNNELDMDGTYGFLSICAHQDGNRHQHSLLDLCRWLKVLLGDPVECKIVLVWDGLNA
jgi:hypothetical protein